MSVSQSVSQSGCAHAPWLRGRHVESWRSGTAHAVPSTEQHIGDIERAALRLPAAAPSPAACAPPWLLLWCTPPADQRSTVNGQRSTVNGQRSAGRSGGRGGAVTSLTVRRLPRAVPLLQRGPRRGAAPPPCRHHPVPGPGQAVRPRRRDAHLHALEVARPPAASPPPRPSAHQLEHRPRELQSKRLLIELRWVSRPLALAGKLRPRRLNK
eukprot:COSAG01_NODE_2348_length_7857_cov_4.460299_13_plen_211_part_00